MQFRRRIAATLEQVSRLSQEVETLLVAQGVQDAGLLALAVQELGVNVVEHAYGGRGGEIDVELELSGRQLELSLRDNAPNGFISEAVVSLPDPLSLPEGGWGLYLIHQIMDRVDYQRRANGNSWQLSKQIKRTMKVVFILVVDDETVTRRLVAYTLRSLEVQTLAAANATEALKLAEENPVSLAIVDLNLPDLDGFTLISRLREIPHMASIPIIVFTARNNPDDTLMASERGAVGFLYKPFSTYELRALVSQHLS
ncbi:MAG: response regulator [Anaerolineae bacterium]|nr:response regulator [Anaerolineae bacterium]